MTRWGGVPGYQNKGVKHFLFPPIICIFVTKSYLKFSELMQYFKIFWPSVGGKGARGDPLPRGRGIPAGSTSLLPPPPLGGGGGFDLEKKSPAELNKDN